MPQDSDYDETWPQDLDDEPWEKAGGGFGPIKKGANDGGGGDSGRTGPRDPARAARFKPGERAALEVGKYQQDGGYLIPKQAFRRLVGEIFHKATEGSEVTRIEKSAIEALQSMSETHMALVLNG